MSVDGRDRLRQSSAFNCGSMSWTMVPTTAAAAELAGELWSEDISVRRGIDHCTWCRIIYDGASHNGSIHL